MKILKPLVITEHGDVVTYDSGYDIVEVFIDRAETDDLHGSWQCTVYWPDNTHEEMRIKPEALKRRIEEYLLEPRVIQHQWTSEDVAFVMLRHEDDPQYRIHRVVRAPLDSFCRLDHVMGNTQPAHQLFYLMTGQWLACESVSALNVSYEIIGFENNDVYLMVSCNTPAALKYLPQPAWEDKRRRYTGGRKSDDGQE